MTTELQPMGRKIIVGSKEMGLPNVNLRNGNSHTRAQTMMENYGNTIDATPASRNNNFVNNRLSQRTLNHNEGSITDLKNAGSPHRFDLKSNASVQFLHDSPEKPRFKSQPRNVTHKRKVGADVTVREMALDG
jgi:hypothetical protein